MTTSREYLPAAGKHWLLPLYDPFVALFTREQHWRGAILDALELGADDVLVDVGCGTGSLAVMAKQRAPRTRVIGLDPDPGALARARRKAERRGLDVTFERGLGDETAQRIGRGVATKVASSFALHHMPREMQLATLAAMRGVLVPGGMLVLADFIGGHFNGPAESSLSDDLAAQGFENPRTLMHFHVAFSRAVLVSARRPHG